MFSFDGTFYASVITELINISQTFLFSGLNTIQTFDTAPISATKRKSLEKRERESSLKRWKKVLGERGPQNTDEVGHFSSHLLIVFTHFWENLFALQA